MKKRSISGLLALVLLACITQAATVKTVPMRGGGNGQIIGQNGAVITAIGSGEATHLGKFTREETITLNDGTVTGTMVFTAADGSQLFCEFAGAFTSAATVAGEYTFTGGTGRFDGATGEAFFDITLGEAGSFSFAFAGTIEMN
jgi:hypothetical protein